MLKKFQQNSPPMAKPTIASSEKRLALAEQNETVRKSGVENTSLATFGLKSCVAVIFADRTGNVSLTHVDMLTDLSFIQDEAKFMHGDFTIDVVAVDHPDNLAKLPTQVLSHLKTEFPLVTNSKGKQEVRKIKYTPDYSKGVLIDCSTLGQISLKQPTWEELKVEFKAIEAGHHPQIRIYEQQLRQFFPQLGSRKPNLIYDQKQWAVDSTALDPRVQEYISQHLLPHKKSREALENACFELAKMQHPNLLSLGKTEPAEYKFIAHNYVVILPNLLEEYWKYLEDEKTKSGSSAKPSSGAQKAKIAEGEKVKKAVITK